MEHPIRGGSKEHARETTPATRTQDNELHAPAGLNQHVDWGAVPEVCFHGQLREVAAEPRDACIQLDFDVREQGIPVQGSRHPGE